MNLSEDVKTLLSIIRRKENWPADIISDNQLAERIIADRAAQAITKEGAKQ